MRTDEARRTVPARLHGGLVGLRRRLARAGPRTRWLVLGVAGLALAVAAAAVVTAGDPVGYAWIDDGPMPREQADRIVAALRQAEVPVVESGGRVGVPAARRGEAVAVLAEKDLGPRPLDELIDEAATAGSFWDGPDDRARRDRNGAERLAREAIRRLPGVQSASVALSAAPEPAGRLRPTAARRFRATVFVQTEEGRELPRDTVEAIRHIVPNLAAVDPDALTVLNLDTGREYLVAGRPDLEARSTALVHEQELRERIARELAIDGARVHVRIDPAAAPAAQAPPAASLANRPVGLVAPDATATEPGRLLSANRVEPDAAPVAPAAGASRDVPAWRATVLVRVPRSYYVQTARSTPGRPPTAEELSLRALQVDHSVRLVVSAIVPPGELADVRIDRIIEPEPLGPPALGGGATGRLPVAVWAPLAGGAALALLGLAALGWGWRSSRRPGPRVGRAAGARRRPGRLTDHAAGPGAAPGERARALVRLDPAAAAGVLHRWVAQGGHAR